MSTKHTPGPWKVRFMNPKEPEESDFFVEAKNNNMPELGYGIDILGDDYGTHNGYPREQRLADAKLIAASPETLSKFQKLTGIVESIVEDYGSYASADSEGKESERQNRKNFFEHELNKHISKLAEAYYEAIEQIKKATN